jgi:HK97 family phage portal protein
MEADRSVLDLILSNIRQTLNSKVPMVKVVPGYPPWMLGQPFALPAESVDYPNAYKLIPSVYACISLIQGAIAALPLKFYKGSPDKKNSIKRAPGSVAELWATANNVDTGYDLIEQIIGSMEINGNSYIYLDYMGGKAPRELWTLPGNMVRPIPGPRRSIEAYELDLGDGTLVRIPEQQIVHFKHYNPDTGIVGLSPLSVAALAYQTERNAGRWLHSFYSKGAIVAGHYSAEQTLADGDIERLKLEIKRRNQGPENAWQPVILPRGLKFERQGLTHTEMQFLQTSQLTTADVMRIFRIPPVLLGVKSGGGLSDAGASADLVLFWQNCIMPRTAKIEAVLNEKLLAMGRFGMNVTCQFDYSNVLALQEVFLSQAEAYQRATGAPVLTRAEARERLGLVKLNDAELDKLIMPKAPTSTKEVDKNPQWMAQPKAPGSPSGTPKAPNGVPAKSPPVKGNPKQPGKTPAAASSLDGGGGRNRLRAMDGPPLIVPAVTLEAGRNGSSNGNGRLVEDWFDDAGEP